MDQAKRQPQPASLPDTDGLQLEPKLTPRQTQVLRMIALGMANKHIASELGIAVHTAEKHVAKLYERAGLTCRVDATRYAWHLGLIDGDGWARKRVALTTEQLSAGSVGRRRVANRTG